MNTIIAITTRYNGQKRFVTATLKRSDKTTGVELSAAQHHAKDFLTQSEAEEVRKQIFNPFGRTYIIERIKITQAANVGRAPVSKVDLYTRLLK